MMRTHGAIPVSAAVRSDLPRDRRRRPAQLRPSWANERPVSRPTRISIRSANDSRAGDGSQRVAAPHPTEGHHHPSHHRRRTSDLRRSAHSSGPSPQPDDPATCLGIQPPPHTLRHHNLLDKPTKSSSTHRTVAMTPEPAAHTAEKSDNCWWSFQHMRLISPTTGSGATSGNWRTDGVQPTMARRNDDPHSRWRRGGARRGRCCKLVESQDVAARAHFVDGVDGSTSSALRHRPRRRRLGASAGPDTGRDLPGVVRRPPHPEAGESTRAGAVPADRSPDRPRRGLGRYLQGRDSHRTLEAYPIDDKDSSLPMPNQLDITPTPGYSTPVT